MINNIENKIVSLDHKLCQYINDVIVEINNLNQGRYKFYNLIVIETINEVTGTLLLISTDTHKRLTVFLVE